MSKLFRTTTFALDLGGEDGLVRSHTTCGCCVPSGTDVRLLDTLRAAKLAILLGAFPVAPPMRNNNAQ